MRTVSLVCVLTFAAGALRPQLAPLRLRLDTRRFDGFTLRATALAAVRQEMIAAFPRETAFCLRGTVDSTSTPVGFRRPARLAIVDRADLAPSDSADAFDVWFHVDSPCRGPDVLGFGHTHPYARAVDGEVCENSVPDVLRLVADTTALMSVVFCGDGRGHVLWQDGRQASFIWAVRGEPDNNEE